MRKTREPSLLQSILPILFLLVLIMVNVLATTADSLAGANQLSLLLAAAFAALFAIFNGVNWSEIMRSVVHTISSAMPSVVILLMVGMLSGSWMISGVIPTMIYYGLDVLQAEYFLPACVIITAAISVSTGSSWSTIATIGVALIGVGDVLGLSPAMTAGAIISGAYFGDKISPLSDTTNLASAVCNTDIFVHIRYMMRTTVPSILLTLIGFVILTVMVDSKSDVTQVEDFQTIISSTYNISLLLLLIPAFVVFLIVRKVAAIPVLMIGSLLAVVVAGFVQQDYLSSLVGGELTVSNGYAILTESLYGRITPSTGNVEMNELLSTGGMAGMINTIWLILTAMIFGGVMEAGRFLERITSAVLSRVHSRAGLVSSTTASCLLFNLSTGDQYMSIVIPGKMFYGAFTRNGLQGRLLSRTLEDSATATSVLVPWNTCGATQATILGVATVAYLPFAFFCLLSPLMTLLVVWTGWGMRTKEQSHGE